VPAVERRGQARAEAPAGRAGPRQSQRTGRPSDPPL